MSTKLSLASKRLQMACCTYLTCFDALDLRCWKIINSSQITNCCCSSVVKPSLHVPAFLSIRKRHILFGKCRVPRKRNTVGNRSKTDRSENIQVPTETKGSEVSATKDTTTSSTHPKGDEIVLFLVAAFWGTNPVCLRQAPSSSS